MIDHYTAQMTIGDILVFHWSYYPNFLSDLMSDTVLCIAVPIWSKELLWNEKFTIPDNCIIIYIQERLPITAFPMFVQKSLDRIGLLSGQVVHVLLAQ